jgi:WD40 repeat protein/class 3 adenylate cyclase
MPQSARLPEATNGDRICLPAVDRSMTSTSTEAPVIRTFLIGDVRGYTAFTQQHGDEAAGRLAGRFAEIAQEGVEACGGVLLELRGDEALAVFMSARNAIRAATELAEAFSEATVDDPALPLGVGFGLDAGEAVPVAGGYRGGALNLAARLCSKAGAGEVLASEGVIHLASTIDGMSYEPTEPFEMKGISEPVRAIRVHPTRAQLTTGSSRKSDHPVDAALPPELDLVSPFVGREKELRWLRWSWRRARHGHGRGVFVIGAPGMGRTRLAAELARGANQDGATVTYIGCAAPTDEAMRRLEEAASTDGPALVIVDDLSEKIQRGREAFELLLQRAQGRDLLVVATCEEPLARRVKDLTEQVDPDGSARRHLEPLSAHEVVELATVYAGASPADLPLSDLMEDTGGSPELLHAYVIDWAVGHVADRLNASATRAGAQRSGLRAAEADLAVTVAEIELARERARIHGMEAGRTTEGAPRPTTMCPFKGLATFDPSDADLFFGREQLIAEMVARSVGARFLGVVGPSGSGKSSAVRAGLMPALAGGALPGSQTWSQRLIRPGPHPMAELGSASTDEGRSILVIDQFEETFTTCADEDERTAFVQAITTDADDRVVIAAVRADFYGRCAEYPSLARLFGMTHVLVGPMDERELRRAIELPARRAGLRVEPSLVEALVGEVADEPGGLPLLSTTLLELWQRRDGRMLTMERYRETGGVRAAVARLAEDAYARLSAQEQIVARAMLLRLAGTEIGDAAIGRRVSLAELDVDHDPDAAEVLTVLADARMLTVSEGSVEVAHDALLREWPRLRGWLEEDIEGRQLHHHLTEAAREWTAGGEDAADLYRGARLASAMDWTAQHTVELNEQERAFLGQSREASQAEIDRTRRMNRRLKGSLTGVALFLVVALVGASLALQQRAHARAIATVAESKRLAAQAVAETDLGRSVQLALAGLTLDDSVDTRGALLQVLQRDPSAIGLIPTSGSLADVAVAPDGRTVVVADQDGSLDFFDVGSRAMVDSPVPVLDNANAYQMAFDPSGRTVAVAGHTGQSTIIGLVDATDHHVTPLTSFGSGNGAMDLAFSPNGKQLAVAFASVAVPGLNPITPRWIDFIDPATRDESYIKVGVFNTEQEAGTPDTWHSTTVAYLPGGTLAVSWFDGGTTIWNVRSQRSVQRFDVGGPALAVSADGRTLAVGQLNGDVTLIDVRTGTVRRMQGHHEGPVMAAAFTPDGRTVITSGIDGQIKLWGVGTSRILATFSGSGALAVSPDGNTLYSSGSAAAIEIWDLSGMHGLTSATNIGAGYPQFAVGGSLIAYQLPGGRLGPATEIGLWDTGTGATSRIPALPGQTCSASLSPDGAQMLESCDGAYGTAAQTDRNIAVWDVSSGTRIGAVMRSSGGATWDGAFSPDGSTFATASDDVSGVAGGSRTSTVIVRDTASMQIAASYPLSGSAAREDGVVFSPDGRLIAAATSGPTPDIRVWDLGSEVLVASPEVKDHIEVKSMAFSPDGRTLALALATGIVRFLDTSTWTDAASPITAAADSISYSPDGTYLAIADAGDVSLWEVASGRRVGDSYVGAPDNRFGTMRFLPDGRIVLMIANEPAFVYRADLASWKAQACSIVGEVTPAQWQQIAPDEPYRSTCTA